MATQTKGARTISFYRLGEIKEYSVLLGHGNTYPKDDGEQIPYDYRISFFGGQIRIEAISYPYFSINIWLLVPHNKFPLNA